MWHASRFLYNSTRTTVIEERWRMDGGEDEMEGKAMQCGGKKTVSREGVTQGGGRPGCPTNDAEE